MRSMDAHTEDQADARAPSRFGRRDPFFAAGGGREPFFTSSRPLRHASWPSLPGDGAMANRISDPVTARGGETSSKPRTILRQPQGGTPSLQRQEAPKDASPPAFPHLELHMPGSLSSSTTPDYLSMRQPFLNRHIYNLWDPDSALRIWQYNYDFFHGLGVSPDLSATLSNLTAPRFIDAQLKAGNPTWWEITDQELHTSTILGTIPLLDFNADFSPAQPSWLKFILGKKGKGH